MGDANSPDEHVLAWRITTLEADVREIRATTVTHTEFGLRFGSLEAMVKEIRDNLANSKTRLTTYVVFPVISGGLVSALSILLFRK